VQEAVRRNLNLTEAAKALHTSQPGVSKAIIELEEELGVEIFARHGKRLKRVTEPGQHVLASIELIMREVGNLKRIGEQFSAQDSGTLSIATTHTQARYVLPVPVAKLREAYPKVNVSLHQGSPDQVARMLIDEVAEIGIATESLADYADLVTLPCYEWQHVLVLPQDHPLAGRSGCRWKTWRPSRSSPTTRPSPAARASTTPSRRRSSRHASRWKRSTRT
jgi:LysR family cys regulon transcriptional activator